MSARGKALICVAAIFLALMLGCGERRVTMKVNETAGVAMLPKHSGYGSNPRQWSEFLQCWQSALHDKVASLPEPERGVPQRSALTGGKIRDGAAASSVSAAIANMENSLGESLPASYKDFLQAYNLGEGPSSSDLKVSVGLFAPSEVARLKSIDPEAVKLAAKYPIETADEKYFVYGVGQDAISGRVRYYADAIFIGKYGPDLFERIVLYPQVKTSDGEMEAALHAHAGEFRAPSFAELMRQLSYLETKGPDAMPPYAQVALKKTCAEKLPLKNVWWE